MAKKYLVTLYRTYAVDVEVEAETWKEAEEKGMNILYECDFENEMELVDENVNVIEGR